MEKVIITSTKIFYAKWDGTKDEWVKTDITKEDKPISFYFPHQVEIGDGVTLEDVLYQLKKFEEHVDLFFSGYMEKCKLADFIAELEKSATDDLSEKLDYIEFYWNANLIPMADDVAEFRLHKFPSMRGVLPTSEDDEDFDEDDYGSLIFEEYHELALVPLKNYKYVPIVLNDMVELYDPGEDLGMIEQSIVDCAQDFSFFDFLSGMFTELSLYGTPADQEKLIGEIANELENEKNTPIIMEPKEFFDYMEADFE